MAHYINRWAPIERTVLRAEFMLYSILTQHLASSGFFTVHFAYSSLALVCLLNLFSLLIPRSFDSIVIMIEVQRASAIFGLFADQIEKLFFLTLLRAHFSRV